MYDNLLSIRGSVTKLVNERLWPNDTSCSDKEQWFCTSA